MSRLMDDDPNEPFHKHSDYGKAKSMDTTKWFDKLGAMPLATKVYLGLGALLAIIILIWLFA